LHALVVGDITLRRRHSAVLVRCGNHSSAEMGESGDRTHATLATDDIVESTKHKTRNSQCYQSEHSGADGVPSINVLIKKTFRCCLLTAHPVEFGFAHTLSLVVLLNTGPVVWGVATNRAIASSVAREVASSTGESVVANATAIFTRAVPRAKVQVVTNGNGGLTGITGEPRATLAHGIAPAQPPIRATSGTKHIGGRTVSACVASFALALK